MMLCRFQYRKLRIIITSPTVHLRKCFQKYFGMSVKKYIASIRLKNAVYQLLNQDEDNITKISFENGFVNMKSFYKTFKDTYLMTPGELKKKMNERK